MRHRSYPFLSRRVIAFNLDDFGMNQSIDVMHDGNVQNIRMVSGDDPDLLYYRRSICPQRGSHNIVNNGALTVPSSLRKSH